MDTGVEVDIETSSTIENDPARAKQIRRAAGTALLLSLGIVSSCASAQRGELTVSDVNRFDFTNGESSDPREIPEGLSGIVHVAADQYLTISDLHAYLHRLAIEVDLTTGRILAARFGTPLPLTDSLGFDFPENQGKDREGVVYDRSTGTIWIANEQAGSDMTMPSIAQHSLETGAMTDLVIASCESALHVFCNIRVNQALESLTRSLDGSEIWTANEQALIVDGGPPTTSEGAVVRLQRLTSALQPLAQYAYVTAPLSGTTPPRIIEWGISGVVELLVLTPGTLLALERAVVGGPAGEPTVRVRLYEVDFSGATDISRSPWASGLIDAGQPYSPVQKRLLIELTGETGPESNFNFEGLALGPRLENGDHSLILVADNRTGTNQTLYALRLSGLSEAP
ncbi:MAG: esterase-like activity of phytase family protein [Gemmatimonadetes bacterium]|nr:esterase-like activity of phytase family protein [Gemmatimonadota bacterium]